MQIAPLSPPSAATAIAAFTDLDAPAATTAPELQNLHPETSFSMRYSQQVDSWRGKRRATHTMSIHSRRLLRFLKKDYHITNLALAFLSRADDEYTRRKRKTTKAFVVCEAFIQDIGGKTSQAVAERKLGPAIIERTTVNFAVLSPNSVRLARLVQDADHILERMMLLENANLILHKDRVFVSQQMIDGFTAIKEAALSNAEVYEEDDPPIE